MAKKTQRKEKEESANGKKGKAGRKNLAERRVGGWLKMARPNEKKTKKVNEPTQQTNAAGLRVRPKEKDSIRTDNQ